MSANESDKKDDRIVLKKRPFWNKKQIKDGMSKKKVKLKLKVKLFKRSVSKLRILSLLVKCQKNFIELANQMCRFIRLHFYWKLKHLVVF